MSKRKNSPSIEDGKHLRIPLQEILSATRGFDPPNFIAKGGYGRVYKGESEKYGKIAVKRWDSKSGQGENEFKTEISLLSKCKHKNIVSLLGFCDEDGEKILVYKYECNGSLDNYIKGSKDLTWIQRLQICLDVACGLNYLHSEVGSHQHFLHRDIKSSNILLDENWKPKISDFGLSRVVPVDMQSTFVISNPCGTPGYIDPEYYLNGYLTQKSDVYSFGVVLWEVLCGKLVKVACNNEPVPLPFLVKKHYKRKTLDKIIPPELHNQINTASLLTFSNIAYQCLKNVEVRPTMSQVVEQLRKALHDQLPHCILSKEVKKPGMGEASSLKPLEGQSVVFLKVQMHCVECATEVEQRLRSFKGVEDILVDFRQKVGFLPPKRSRKTSKFLGGIIGSKKPKEFETLEASLSSQSPDSVSYLGSPDSVSHFRRPIQEKNKEERIYLCASDELQLETLEGSPEEFEPEEFETPEEFKFSQFPDSVFCLGSPDSVSHFRRPIQEKNKEEGLLRVLLKVHLHCEDCAQKIKKTVMKTEGVISAVHDINKSELVVTGSFDVEVLVDSVHKKTGEKVIIVSIEP